ncbi:hypothetical protein [Chryseobacterium hagamense]|uniref:Uncharacterized protein n=1 Tax=Chryseobacterium hagamense TaxID=395935 RepID=A0A511YJV7_9FLAO|nr:hypothetical protein [Chryseobacterium hagamense]GEN75481.1 hypothetical protein CHA01nite_12210 [Chryseobacterium hagamense]
MSKKKLLITEVFKKAEEESQRDTKNGLASYLWLYFKEDMGFDINDRSFSRYYDAYVIGNKEIRINPDRLDMLSEYLGYKNFDDFSGTFVKENNEVNKTTVKVSVDNDEESLTEKLSKIVINITNEQYFKIPDFLKKNGMGIVEMAFLVLLVTGGVVFSKDKKSTFGFASLWGTPATEKPYMYWDKDRYIASDSSYIGPQINMLPMKPEVFVYQKKITRPDTLTIENGDHKVWYDKTNNHVEFFTNYGMHPENGKALKIATRYIIETYAGTHPKEEFADN